ncbi:MAG: hypothetical protein IJA90_10680 [Peptococcaceae bacterium]|nr:hypothetical protein [Peptococcaceae bacterium]
MKVFKIGILLCIVAQYLLQYFIMGNFTSLFIDISRFAFLLGTVLSVIGIFAEEK